MALGGSRIQLPPGVYHADLVRGYRDKFRVIGNGTIDNPEPGVMFRRTFALAFSGDRNALRDLVYSLLPRVEDGLWLRVLTWQGEVFLSWYQPANRTSP